MEEHQLNGPFLVESGCKTKRWFLVMLVWRFWSLGISSKIGVFWCVFDDFSKKLNVEVVLRLPLDGRSLRRLVGGSEA